MDGWMDTDRGMDGADVLSFCSSGRCGGAVKYASLACFLVQNYILCVNEVPVVRFG
jgi:hypothetical protein